MIFDVLHFMVYSVNFVNYKNILPNISYACAGLPQRPEVTACIESEANDHSLPSADDGSSGYESFAFNKESGRGSESGGECESPCGSAGEGGDTEVCASGGGDVNRNYSPNKTQSNLLPLRKSLSMYMNMNVFSTTPFIGKYL